MLPSGRVFDIIGVVMKLNIKRRLKISNILMLAIPICVSVIAGVISLAVFFAVLNGTGVRFSDEYFYNGKEIVAKFVEESLESDEPIEALGKFSSFTKSDNLRLTILKNDEVYYDCGNKNASDGSLSAMTDTDGGEIFVSDGARQLYFKQITRGEDVYRTYIYCTNVKVSYKQIKIAAVIIAGVVFAIAVLSIILSDRFLSRFVFKKIEKPIDALTVAAKEVADGNLGYRVFYGEDDEFLPVIEEFNHMTARLKKSSEMLKDEENSRNLMLTGITHDIKSPLTVISGYADGLCEGVADTPEKRNKYLQTIKRKCAEINLLVGKMILLTKTEYELSACEETIDVAAEINKFLAEEREIYAEKGLKISFTVKAPMQIKCTKENFARILENLADNSLKYKTGEIGNLDILLKSDDDITSLVFSDDGAGVNEEDLPHIFEPFYRADKSRAKSSENNGIGLAVVKRIVTAAGGEINAYNNEKGGLSVLMALKKQDGKNTDC